MIRTVTNLQAPDMNRVGNYLLKDFAAIVGCIDLTAQADVRPGGTFHLKRHGTDAGRKTLVDERLIKL